MSDNRDKPAEFDPDATVMQQPKGRPDADPDATVMMPSRKALTEPDAEPDADATVMMRASDLTAPPDEDATVMMKAGLGAEPSAEAKPERKPLAAFQTEADPDATVIGAPPPEPEPAPVPVAAAPAPQVAVAAPASAPPPELSTPVTADSSRMPLIAGGLVVVAVALYFAFSGGKPPPKPEAAPAPGAASATPATAAPAPAAPAATAAAPAAAPAAAAPAPAAKGADLKSLLAAETKRGTIALAEEGGATTITLRSTNQFASGGVDLEPKLQPVIAAIAAALDKAPGAIVVTGHADAKPSSNPKYPSNQELSTARGASVAKLLAGKLRDPKRVSSAGASDSQPVAPSDTPDNRAKNRRVVIVLRPAS